jgi:hypothetical protein
MLKPKLKPKQAASRRPLDPPRRYRSGPNAASFDAIAHLMQPMVSRPEKFHPQPLSKRCGSFSTHTAPIK